MDVDPLYDPRFEKPGIAPDTETIRQSIYSVLETRKSPDGGIHPIGLEKKSDVCLNGMFLNYACYWDRQVDQVSLEGFAFSPELCGGEFIGEVRPNGEGIISCVSVACSG